MKHDEGTRLSLLIESVLTRDILYPKWRKVVKEYHHITTGCCYPASEALYHLWGKTNGFEPCYLGFDDAGYIPGIGHCTHWFLRHEDGRVLDPTAKQFSVPLDYSKGRFCGYLTKSPSKRAKGNHQEG